MERKSPTEKRAKDTGQREWEDLISPFFLLRLPIPDHTSSGDKGDVIKVCGERKVFLA